MRARNDSREGGKEPQLYAPRSDCRDCDAKNRPTCHGRLLDGRDWLRRFRPGDVNGEM